MANLDGFAAFFAEITKYVKDDFGEEYAVKSYIHTKKNQAEIGIIRTDTNLRMQDGIKFAYWEMRYLDIWDQFPQPNGIRDYYEDVIRPTVIDYDNNLTKSAKDVSITKKKQCTCGQKHTGGKHSDWCDILEKNQ